MRRSPQKREVICVPGEGQGAVNWEKMVQVDGETVLPGLRKLAEFGSRFNKQVLRGKRFD